MAMLLCTSEGRLVELKLRASRFDEKASAELEAQRNAGTTGCCFLCL